MAWSARLLGALCRPTVLTAERKAGFACEIMHARRRPLAPKSFDMPQRAWRWEGARPASTGGMERMLVKGVGGGSEADRVLFDQTLNA